MNQTMKVKRVNEAPWIISVCFLTPVVLSLSKARNLNMYVIKIVTSQNSLELKTLTAWVYTLQFPKSNAKKKKKNNRQTK